MAQIRSIARKVRSKNAGPFWLTVDIFCGSDDAFERISSGLKTSAVADRFGVNGQTIKRFDIAELNVIKISLPRPVVQGSRADRDMHGASFSNLIAELEI